MPIVNVWRWPYEARRGRRELELEGRAAALRQELEGRPICFLGARPLWLLYGHQAAVSADAPFWFVRGADVGHGPAGVQRLLVIASPSGRNAGYNAIRARHAVGHALNLWLGL